MRRAGGFSRWYGHGPGHRSGRWSGYRTSYRTGWLLALPAILLLGLCFVVPLCAMVQQSVAAVGPSVGAASAVGQSAGWTLSAYHTLWVSAYYHDILWFTLWLGVVLACICVLIAYPLALVITRLPPGWRLVALAAVVLPKLANVLVVVYGLKLILSNAGPVNHLLRWLGLVDAPVRLLNNLAGVIIGETYLILPYTILILVVALARITPELTSAASGLGANGFQRFRWVTWPLSRAGLAMAFFVSLVFGIGAFVSPYLLGSPEQLTVSVDVQRQTFQNLDWPRGAAEAMTLLAILMVALAGGLASRGLVPRWVWRRSPP